MDLLLPASRTNLNLLSYYIDEWIEMGLRLNISSVNSPLIWACGENSILVWPWDQVTHIIDGSIYASNDIDCKAKIYFNELPASGSDNIYPSFYWARNPRLAELKSKHWHSWEQRPIRSSFVGKYENMTQAKYRLNLGYETVIDEFILLGPSDPYPFDSNQYYDRLLSTRYSLCPRGYGPKTHREIESFATGAVVLMDITTSDYAGYYEPLIPFEHFIPFEQPKDIPSIINSISPQQWLDISLNALQWYNRNCTPESAYRILSEIISNIKL